MVLKYYYLLVYFILFSKVKRVKNICIILLKYCVYDDVAKIFAKVRNNR